MFVNRGMIEAADTEGMMAGVMAHEMSHAKPDDKRADFITDQALRDKQIDPTLAVPADRIDWMQNLFVKANVIPKAVPVDSPQ